MKVKLLCWKHKYNTNSDRSQFSALTQYPHSPVPPTPPMPFAPLTPKQHLSKWSYKT